MVIGLASRLTTVPSGVSSNDERIQCLTHHWSFLHVPLQNVTESITKVNFSVNSSYLPSHLCVGKGITLKGVIMVSFDLYVGSSNWGTQPFWRSWRFMPFVPSLAWRGEGLCFYHLSSLHLIWDSLKSRFVHTKRCFWQPKFICNGFFFIFRLIQDGRHWS